MICKNTDSPKMGEGSPIPAPGKPRDFDDDDSE